MSFLRKLFGLKPAPNYAEMMANGAIILDVRTKGEFQSGHIKGSKNIPLSDLYAYINKAKDKNTPIITCCASGMRSGSAKTLLKANGFSTVYNGGGWRSLKSKL